MEVNKESDWMRLKKMSFLKDSALSVKKQSARITVWAFAKGLFMTSVVKKLKNKGTSPMIALMVNYKSTNSRLTTKL